MPTVSTSPWPILERRATCAAPRGSSSKPSTWGGRY
jgi:hypothetical protein